MDVTELRSAFNATAAVSDRIQRFRDDRLAKIIAGETPIPMTSPHAVILHIVPLVSTDPSHQLDLKKVPENNQWMPMGRLSGYSGRYNIDGYVRDDRVGNQLCSSYAQVFRSGMIEAVNAEWLIPPSVADRPRVIPITGVEGALIDAIAGYLNALRNWGVTVPIAILLSLIGVKGYLVSDQAFDFDGLHPIDRDTLFLPDLLLEQEGALIGPLMRPAFDALWQASGVAQSPNFDDQGNRVRRRA